MSTREKSPARRNTPTFTQDGPQQQHAASTTLLASSIEGLSPFLTVLVTPKLNFSLPRQPHWQTPEDIGQDELRSAFLSRFPVRIDVGGLTFTCSTPAVDLRAKERLVFKLSAGSDDDERVMLSLLQELDKARARAPLPHRCRHHIHPPHPHPQH